MEKNKVKTDNEIIADFMRYEGEYSSCRYSKAWSELLKYDTFDDFEKITLADIGRKTDIKRFDKIYFDYRVTEDDNLVGKHEGKELYKVRVDQVLCVIREDEIIVQGGWCLVEPNMETWEEITTKSGIVMKPQPQAKYLEGIVRHISPDYNIVAGDKILYEKHADWTVHIEGNDYYAIEESDILGKFVKIIE
jgi:co-chaperonin GroES (HSP10)